MIDRGNTVGVNVSLLEGTRARIELRVCVYHTWYLVVFLAVRLKVLVQRRIYSRYSIHRQAAIEAILFITPGLHMRVREHYFVLAYRSSMLSVLPFPPGDL